MYELEADPLNMYRHCEWVQGNGVIANDEMDRDAECNWNLLALKKAARNKSTAMIFIKKRLQLPPKLAMKNLAVLKADVL